MTFPRRPAISVGRTSFALAGGLVALVLAAWLPARVASAGAPEHPPAATAAINVADGATFIEWWPVLANRDNVQWDESGSVGACPTDDVDCKPLDPWEDLRRVAWAADATRVYFYLERQASVASTVNFLLYLDEDADGRMEAAERVLRVNWTSGRAISVELLGYQPVGMGGDPMTAAGTGDGVALLGVVPNLGSPDPGAPATCANCGSLDGRAAEFAVPWSVFKRGGTPRAFTWHVTSTKGLAGQTSFSGTDARDNIGGSAITHSVSVEPAAPSLTVAPGAQAALTFTIAQLGNVPGLAEVTVRSETGSRIELHQGTATGPRLGVDANGDGDFSDADDTVSVDADMDGTLDTGVTVNPGGTVTVVALLTPPATAVGFVDRVELVAAPASSVGRVERALLAVHSGPVTIRTDSEAAGIPGDFARHRHVVTNHTMAAMTVDLTATGALAASFRADSGGNPGAPLGDSNANATPDVALTAGESRPVWVTFALPSGAQAGSFRDLATVTATPAGAPANAARVTDTSLAFNLISLRHVHAAGTPRGVQAAAPSGLAWFSHEAVNASPQPEEVFLSAQVVAGQLDPPVVVSDPNGDGNPEDGVVLDFGASGITIPAYGGRLPFLVVAPVRKTAPSSSVLQLRARADTLASSASTVDEARTQSGVAKLTSPWEVQASAFGPCESIAVDFGDVGLAGAGDVVWTGPAGRDRVQARWTDGWSTARDTRPADGLRPGVWDVTLAGEEVTFRAESALAVDAPAVVVDTTARTLSLTTALRNEQDVADVASSTVETWVLTAGAQPGVAGGFILVSDGLTARVVANTGLVPTRTRRLGRFQEGTELADRAVLRGITWSQGTSFEVHVRALDACGQVLDTASTAFSTAPGGGSVDLLRSAELTSRTLMQHGAIFTGPRPPSLDPVRHLRQAGVGALMQITIAGDGRAVGDGTAGVVIFYEVTTRPGPLRVARSGSDVILRGW